MTWVAVGAGAVALGTAGVKYFKGRGQQKKGEALERSNVRPVYQRPGEVTTALNLAERNFNNGMPGSSLAQSRLGSSAATAYGNAMDGASSSGDLLDAATKINLNTNNATNDLATQEANYKNNAMQNYIAQLGVSGAYGDKEFDYNQNQPFQETAAKAASLIGAGNQNQFGALNDVGQVATSVLMSGIIGGKQPSEITRVDPVNNAIAPITTTPQISNLSSNSGISMPGYASAVPALPQIGSMNGAVQPIKAQSIGAPQIPNSFDPSNRGKMVYDPSTGTIRFVQ